MWTYLFNLLFAIVILCQHLIVPYYSQVSRASSEFEVSIEWSDLSINYPLPLDSVGVEIYNNTIYGLMGYNGDLNDSILYPPKVYSTNIDDLFNGSAVWTLRYEWNDFIIPYSSANTL